MTNDAMGNPKNLSSFFRGMQKAQEDFEQWKNKFNDAQFTGSAGGGLVKVVMSGNRRVQSVCIDPQALDDREMLQDLIASALSDVLKKRDDAIGETMNIPLPDSFRGML